ncbi:unnamed protein product [Colias eurytheme]|nr:unnamed protein product [Colias eurytheme]
MCLANNFLSSEPSNTSSLFFANNAYSIDEIAHRQQVCRVSVTVCVVTGERHRRTFAAPSTTRAVRSKPQGSTHAALDSRSSRTP